MNKKLGKFIDTQKENFRLRMLRLEIEYFHRNSHDPEIIELRDNIKRYGIRPFLGNFTQKYENFHVDIMREKNNGCFWVIHNGAKLFFPSHSNEQGAATAYMKLCREQDIASPHRYVNDYGTLKDCYVIEAGAAEASFSLDALINGCKKAYIFECNAAWIESLNKTFVKYGDRVNIIQKYISSSDTDNTISIDSIFNKAIQNDGFSFENDKVFIKMDIEGMEEAAIKGMQYVLEHAKHIELAICAYHKQDDEQMIRSYFPENRWEIETSTGYMLFPYDKKQKPPYFRRGVLRIKKKHL